MDFSNGEASEQMDSHWQPTPRPNEDEQDTGPASIPQMTSATHQERPVMQQRSQSHLSFAQDESDEEEQEKTTGRLDPAWGIKRADSAQILETVHRSPSFPPEFQAIPLSPHSSISYEQQAQSFPGTTMEVNDEQDALPTATEAEAAIHAQVEEPQQTEVGDEQERSRYDEGLPLIAQEDAEPAPEIVEEAQASALGNMEEEATDDYFTQTQDNLHPAADARPHFDRKETSDVLDGLGVKDSVPDSPPLHSATTSDPIPAPPREKDLTAAFGAVEEENDFASAFGQKPIQDEEDPWQAALADEDEFLIEDADDLLPDSDEELEILPPRPAQVVQTQRSSNLARTNSNPYAPHQPSTSDLMQFGSTAQSIGMSRQLQNPMQAFQSSQRPPNITNRAESYVDQAKGGYKSPYDLPMDLAPKKRVQARPIVPPTNAVPPPPRSSSMSTDKQLQSPFTPTAHTFNQAVTASPISPPVQPPVDRSASVPGKPVQPPKRGASGFFEELPIATRARPTPPVSRAPAAQMPQGLPRHPSAYGPGLVTSPPQIQQPPQQPPQPPADPYAQFGLQQPQKLDPYANEPLQSTQQAPLAPAPPAVNARYSPAPPGTLNGVKPSPSPRYSPAPPQVGGPRYSPAPPPAPGQPVHRYVSQPTASFAHVPRTSSPLAQHRRSADGSAEQRPLPQHSASSSLPHATSFSEAAANTLSPPRVVADPLKQSIVPPRRSQTQSPGQQTARSAVPPRIAPPPNRPASAFGQLSPTRRQAPQSMLSPPRIPQQRQVEELDYIRPNDETVNDPLERWKGMPIFRFGFGGAVVTSFPRRTPRYSAGATRPQIKATAGEINIKTLDALPSTSETTAKFPGPLKGKAKKKEVLIWLSSSISNLEGEVASNPSKKLEEKIVLWKAVKVLVEQDGNLEGQQAVQSLSSILMPEVYAFTDSTTSQHSANDPSMGIYRPASFAAKSETVDPASVERLRKTLLQGKRQDAVWQAVDSRLWSHALLLASTLDRLVWKQVVAEFVKQEVKTIGANADSLCAFYEVLGGNMEESVDQLVPPSARAGLQMVSKSDAAGPTRNALDGLDRWRETLCLILNNRSVEDQHALVTLARLLADYGRVEAAHLCYLIARSIALPHMFGGADDTTSMIVLLGADHRNQPLTFQNDTDAIQLTEVYEFSISTLAVGSAGAPMPHLAAYKFRRAQDLADTGMKTEAQAYCEAILSGLKSSTKSSLYYNPILVGQVEELLNRLKQVPVPSAKWIAKPSVEKVTGSLFNKFSSFVTGEDSDAESKKSERDAAESGPFAKVNGSPTLSRNASQTDLYGSYPAQMQMTAPAATAAGSRYAPNGMSSARSSSELTRGRPSVEYQLSPPSTSYSNSGSNPYAPVLQPADQYASFGMSSPPVTSYQPQSMYQPSSEPHMPSIVQQTQQPVSYTPETQHTVSYTPDTPSVNGMSAPQPAFGGYTPMESPYQPENNVQSMPASVEPQQSGFEPPSGDTGYGYQPPEATGYVPYEPEAEDDDERPKPKKPLMDDDDISQVTHGPAANAGMPASTGDNEEATRARKRANDEAAEAAFKAAAEADAQRAKEQATKKKASGSWLGGWLGGAKKPDSLDAAPAKSSGGDAKVHRVHLGESKMKLYYDNEKKKWVNPDNPDAAEKKAAPPPPRASTGSAPPMGGPPRSVSTPYSLPPGGISRTGTPASVALDTGSEGGDSRPGTGNGQAPNFAATLPPGTQQSLGLGGALPTPPGSSGGPAASGSGPPSRPASALSAASGLDDLLGGPPTAGGRKVSGRGTAKGKKGRYVDVMATS